MSCYTVPKRLLHILFGGSAIWLGTTFCSPLTASDLEMPPGLARAPDALTAPEQTVMGSIVPAASLAADHWDTGPVIEDEFCQYGAPCEDGYCDEFFGKSDYDYAAPEESYAGNVTTEEAATESEETPSVDDYWNSEESCCDEYAYGYDGYDTDDAESEESPAADGLVDKPEDSVCSDLESGYEDYSYDDDYDETYAHDESMNAGEEESESLDEEFYCYEFEDEYGYDGGEMSTMDEQPVEVAEMQVEEHADSSTEDDFSYEFDDYEMYYGYDTNAADEAEEAEVAATTTAVETAEEATVSLDSDWEDYYYQDEHQYYRDEYESDSETVAEETVAEEAWADEYEYDEAEYDTYEYDANDYEYDYGMEDAYEAETATEEPADSSDELFDYVDPMNQYGYEYEVPNDSMEMEAQVETAAAQELSAWKPTDLLDDADCDLIRSIDQLSDEPASMRRASLNEYIESLGFEAIDFAYRYEDATDTDVLALAEDLPGAAAFLASHRLVERGQMDMDDAVVMLEGALSGMSLDWIEEVGSITAPNEMLSASHPVVEVMVSVATQSIVKLNAFATEVSQRVAELPWAELSNRFEEARSAFRPSLGEDAVTF